MEAGAEFTMKRVLFLLIFSLVVPAIWCGSLGLSAQDEKPSTQKQNEKAPPASSDSATAQSYSGTYSFLKEGEFLQLTVEDGGTVTGFISRYGDGESDKGAFLDQFFKTGKLDGSKLSFTTEMIHGVGFDFRGSVERGEGKNPGDEAYYVLKGTLTQNISDANKKVTSHPRPAVFKMFPQDAAPAPAVRK